MINDDLLPSAVQNWLLLLLFNLSNETFNRTLQTKQRSRPNSAAIAVFNLSFFNNKQGFF
ncbi:MAG: hypothetical protein IGS48_21410 [Oscillatoriales cyanobacterium C42_A2020_001]|nr:hypothetical protein [Leptolyngbyaceae cyanobacterium C42_A2020_001]